MNLLKFAVACVILFQCSKCFSQSPGRNLEKDKLLNLKSDFYESKTGNDKKNKFSINTTAAEKKSPALAVLLSALIPGAGHLYIGRFDVGKYFVGADAAFWLGLATLNVYGNSVNDDAITYSVQYAHVTNPDAKDDDFFTNVGNFNSVYEYNNDQLIQGLYNSLYDVNAYYWNWDNNVQNRNIFDEQRESSERILNTRIVFGSLLIANRVVACISAYLLTNKPKSKSSSLNVLPELLYKNDLSFDGFKFNISKNF